MTAGPRRPEQRAGQEARACTRYSSRPWLSCATFLVVNGVGLRPGTEVAERLVTADATGETDEVKTLPQGLRELVAAEV